MPLSREQQQELSTGVGPRGRNQQYQQEQEEAERIRKANVRTAIRSESAKVTRGTPGATAQRATAIPQTARRSGIEVTRPAENRFLRGRDITGVNELERNRNRGQ